MTTLEFLNHLRHRGIQLWIGEGDKLKLRSPKGAMTPHLKQELRDRKADIMAFLKRGVKSADQQEQALVQVADKQSLPLSFAQERLWFVEKMQPGTTVYLMPEAWHIYGPLNLDHLEQALAWLIARQEIFRTAFIEQAGEPRLSVSKQVPFHLERQTVAIGPGESEDIVIKTRLRQLAGEPFDLANAPLFRAIALRVDGAEKPGMVLFFNTHHLISDFISAAIFIEELTYAYGVLGAGMQPALPPLEFQYSDFTNWQRNSFDEGKIEAQLAYWRAQLSDAPLVEFPTDRPRPVMQTHQGAVINFTIDAGCHGQLRNLAKASGASLFMVLLAAFKVLVYRYTGQTDLSVGTSIGNRNHPQMDRVIGLFVNLLVMRDRLDPSETFLTWLGRVKDTALDAYAHQEVPFEKVVEICQTQRDMSRHPLFQLQFFLTSEASGGMAVVAPEPEPSGSVRWVPFDWGDGGIARVDLTLGIKETDDYLGGSLEYNTDLFDYGTIARLRDHYRHLLQAIVTNPNQLIDSFVLESPAERAVLMAGNLDIQTFKSAAGIHRRFEEMAALQPDAIALISDAEQISYGVLDRQANRWARLLRAEGVGPEVTVGLCVDRGPSMIIGLLAILKAGGAYVPIDPHTPADRQAYILEDAQVAVLLSEQTWLNSLTVSSHLPVWTMDQPPQQLWQQSDEAIEGEVHPDQAAYIIYTSGSTGKPKGTLIPHANVLRLLDACQAWFNFGRDDRWTLFHSVAFDFSVWEIWGPLLNGGQLVLVPHWVSRSPDAFLELLDRERITVLNQTPSAFLQLLHLECRQKHESRLALRWVIFGGEALHFPTLEPWYQRYADDAPRLVNMYGITETTVHVTFRSLHRDDTGAHHSLIGERIPDLELHVLDPHGHLVPVGVPGELCVAGAGLARGYLRRPGLTAIKFVPHPFSSVPGARLYRSGDTGRWLEHGDLAYTGRLDSQVKLRGFRIELGEIERRLEAHERVAHAVVLLRQLTGRDARLVAYWVGAAEDNEATPELEPAELRDFLSKSLPDYMMPTSFVALDKFPLTANGKIDRTALPEPEIETFSEDLSEPDTRTERILLGIWTELLNRPQMGMNEDFFELGGHSLLATQMMARVAVLTQTTPPVRSVFENPTIRALASEIDRLQSESSPDGELPLVPVPHEGALPLSYAQERLWFLDRLVPGDPTYNIPIAMQFKGHLDPLAYQQAWQDMMARHEVLRTRFERRGAKPVQLIREAAPLDIEWIDLSHFSRERALTSASEIAAGKAAIGFDLAQDWLIRCCVIRIDATSHTILLNLHHIIFDGWSMPIIGQEWQAFYFAAIMGQPLQAQPLPVQYADYAVWQRAWLQGAELERQLKFWEDQLVGAPPSLALPFDYPRPPLESHAGRLVRFQFGEDEAQALAQLNRSESATPFMSLLAAFSVLLGRYGNTADLTIGTPIANRSKPEVQGLIGFLVNTLVLRLDLSGDPNFRELIARSRAACLAAFAHQDAPFEQVVERVNPERNMSQSPLFQVSFMVTQMAENLAGSESQKLPGLTLVPEDVTHQTAKFDLTMSLSVYANLLVGEIEYRTALFKPETMDRFIAHFQSLLPRLLTFPDLPVSGLTQMDEIERERVLNGWNQTHAELSGPPWLHELIEAQVWQRPEATACLFEGEALSYQDLDRWANRLAHRLIAAGVGLEIPVVLCLERSFEMVVAIVAVLKAGGAFVPIAPDSPDDRLSFMLDDCNPPVILTQARFSDRLSRSGSGKREVLCLDDDGASLAAYPTDAPFVALDGQVAAYKIYTSGSTGKPKLTVNGHEGILNRILWVQELFQLTPEKRLMQKTPYTFDVSLGEFFWPLTVGAMLVIAKPDGHKNPAYLAKLIADAGVTHIHFVPSMLDIFLRTADLDVCASIELVMSSGEALSAELIQRFHQGMKAELHNLYGPTEAAIEVSHFVCQPDHGTHFVPIGKPVPNTRLYIVDSGLRPVAVGVPGELLIGGIQVGRGYGGRPGLTARQFVPDPFAEKPGSRVYRTGDLVRWLGHGDIAYLGRIDTQVKVRGFRIELGEIESALLSQPRVAAAVVNVWKTVKGERRLAAYVVPGPADSSVEETDWVITLKRNLRDRLPEYMIPSEFVMMEAIPLAASGKANRKALPAPVIYGSNKETRVSPRNPLERAVADVWQEVLGHNAFGVEDSFFEVGGNSLAAVQMAANLEHRLACDFPLASVFRQRTIAEMVRYLQDERPSGPVQWLKREGEGAPWVMIHPIGGQIHWYLELANRLNKPVLAIESPGLRDQGEVTADLRQLASRYLDLLEQVGSGQDYRFFGWSFGGSVAFEMARQRSVAGTTPSQLVLLDALNFRAEEFSTGEEAALLLTFASELVPHAAIDPALWQAELGNRQGNQALAWLRDRLVDRGYLPVETVLAGLQKLFRVYRAHSQAGSEYVPTTSYDGSVTLIRAMQTKHSLVDKGPYDGTFNWDAFCSQTIDVYDLAGGHYDGLSGSQVDQLAIWMNDLKP